jgi:hypothetical protein
MKPLMTTTALSLLLGTSLGTSVGTSAYALQSQDKEKDKPASQDVRHPAMRILVIVVE